MSCTVEELIKVAKAEVGYLEKKSNKNLNSKTANAGEKNYTKYEVIFGFNGEYWCDCFQSWCFYTACGNSKTEARKMLCGSFSAACETTRQAFIKKNRYHTKSPKKGDLIFFKGTRHSGANHIGLVYKVDSNFVYTIEGNASDGKQVIDNGGAVVKKAYLLNYNKILGYGTPIYSDETPTLPVLPDESFNVNRTYYQLGDGTTTLKNYKTQIKRIQQCLNYVLKTSIPVNGKYDDQTVITVKQLQKLIGTSQNGKFGNVCLKYIKDKLK